MKRLARPIANIKDFELAIEMASLNDVETQIIDYIRYIGTFTQPILRQSLNLDSKPPVLSILCNACRKIGANMPEHFEKVRAWSEFISLEGVRWDGDLICSTTFNIDGERLVPELGTSQYHNFAVHKELFIGFE